MKNPLRMGVTMREVRNPSTGELRDAVAAAWTDFLAWAVPEGAWLPLPNAGGGAVQALETFGLNALILTGGDDLGASERRDGTERALLELCRTRELPVFGVCRGAQLMWDTLGGALVPVEGHVAQRHPLRSANAMIAMTSDVNSYHRWGLPGGAIPEPITPLAFAPDGSVEAFACPARRWTAVMWHPERETPFRAADRALLREALGVGPARVGA
ncbi:MAG: gamma-glutamyl-gamma-aminobutyrate hydrolase family protein [Burkholderiales bacterium]|nr:gamma-glutamyl-gamma-aminobutyrate hydrolase family protein [Burkholderiales bacterium]